MRFAKQGGVGLLLLGIVVCCPRFIEAAMHEFGSGDNVFAVEFVTVGDVGNQADVRYQMNPDIGTPGAVSYPFEIAKFEAVEDSVDKAIVGGLAVKVDQRGPNSPVTAVTFSEAARYANWLNSDSGYPAAYKFENNVVVDWSPEDEGYNSANPTRNGRAKYALPTLDEWYKAAYYDGASDLYVEYPTGTNDPPSSTSGGTEANTAVFGGVAEGPVPPVLAGGESRYGTIGQGGNVAEWLESRSVFTNEGNRQIRGGAFLLDEQAMRAGAFSSADSMFESSGVGFRVVAVPEPSFVRWFMLAIGAIAAQRRRVAS